MFKSISRSTVAKSTARSTKNNKMMHFQSSCCYLNTQTVESGRVSRLPTNASLSSSHPSTISETNSLTLHPNAVRYSNNHLNKPFEQLDFSWLPKAPSTKNFDAQDITTQQFYNGYRPLPINPDSLRCSDGNSYTVYEISVPMNAAPANEAWVSSATGMEQYPEWKNIPKSIRDSLKPFQPVNIQEHINDQILLSTILAQQQKLEQQMSPSIALKKSSRKLKKSSKPIFRKHNKRH